MDYKKFFLPEFFLLFLLVLTGFNNYNGALDKVGFQWLYLSLLNIIFILFFFYKGNTFSFKYFFKNPIIFFFLLFLIWSLLSFFYAYNTTEFILVFSRWFLVFISIINVTTLFYSYENRNQLFIFILISALIGELYFSGSTFLQIISLTNYDFSYANLLKGVTGNKNITASILCFKLPILFYSFYRYKNFFLRSFLFAITTFTIILLFAISSRAMIISIFAIYFLLFLYIIYSYFKSLHSTSQLKLIVFSSLAPLILSVFIFQSVLPQNQNIDLISRASTINVDDSSTSSRLRFYGHALTQVKNNPIIGVGLGNWKFESIKFDKESISGYTVPYHVHNDFLEVATELGLLGVFFYISIFGSFLFLLFKLFVLDPNNRFFYFTLFLSSTVYFIDSNLNFPYARVVNQVLFIFIVSIVLSNYFKLKSIK